MKVGYLGPNGTFSEEAALRYFRNTNADFELFETIPDVIEAVGEGKIDKGIVPLENTIEGTINMTIDGLLSYKELQIEGELTLPVSLHLLANKDTLLDKIEEVWSISPILTQCRKYIKMRSVKSLHYDSSASAATHLKNSGRIDVGAIGPAILAEILGLKIIEENIQDNPDNQTRFVIITRGENQTKVLMKTMFVITPGQEQPGVLSSILNVFTALSINLSWIESRPTTKKLGSYRFLLEANNNCDEITVKKAVTILEALGHQVRILGRYNAFDNAN